MPWCVGHSDTNSAPGHLGTPGRTETGEHDKMGPYKQDLRTLFLRTKLQRIWKGRKLATRGDPNVCVHLCLCQHVSILSLNASHVSCFLLMSQVPCLPAPWVLKLYLLGDLPSPPQGPCTPPPCPHTLPSLLQGSHLQPWPGLSPGPLPAVKSEHSPAGTCGNPGCFPSSQATLLDRVFSGPFSLLPSSGSSHHLGQSCCLVTPL